MEEIRLGLVGMVIANIVLAFLFGTFPLVAGLVAGNRRYAFLGFVLSVAGGALLGIFLAFPLAMLFFWLILRNAAVPTAEADPAPTSNPEVEPDSI